MYVITVWIRKASIVRNDMGAALHFASKCTRSQNSMTCIQARNLSIYLLNYTTQRIPSEMLEESKCRIKCLVLLPHHESLLFYQYFLIILQIVYVSLLHFLCCSIFLFFGRSHAHVLTYAKTRTHSWECTHKQKWWVEKDSNQQPLIKKL